jgi:hypothetical protein
LPPVRSSRAAASAAVSPAGSLPSRAKTSSAVQVARSRSGDDVPMDARDEPVGTGCGSVDACDEPIGTVSGSVDAGTDPVAVGEGAPAR